MDNQQVRKQTIQHKHQGPDSQTMY